MAAGRSGELAGGSGELAGGSGELAERCTIMAVRRRRAADGSSDRF
jgi:X-X-X-Leu-X-X-Gly heptad repeat protein